MDDVVQENIGSLIRSLQELLGRFADDNGVRVQYNTRDRRYIRFLFVTPDRMKVVIKYNVNETSREYIDNMIGDLKERIQEEKRQRHLQAPIIVTSGKRLQ